MASTNQELILASGSRARRDMMERSGLSFKVVPSQVDEAAVRDAMQASAGVVTSPCEVAELLARAKALDVSRNFPSAVVIGADQVLSIGSDTLKKPRDRNEARATLAQLRGRTHELHSAVAIAEAGSVAWSASDTARLTMRNFTDEFVEYYLRREGDAVLEAVGAFRLEAIGVQLFEQIEGDYFTILGLPLLKLMAQLRERDLVLA